MMVRTLKLLFIAAVLALTGCAASIQRDGSGTDKLTVSPVASKRIALDIQASKELAASKDWEQFRGVWRSEMAVAASGAGMTLVPADAALKTTVEPTTLVTVNINDYRYVTRAARVAVGIMTGNAYVNADVSFAELPAATPLGTRKYATTSSAMQGVFAPMTERQISGICEEIVREIAQR